MKSIIIKVPDNIKESFKAHCAIKNITMTEVISKYIYKVLNQKRR